MAGLRQFVGMANEVFSVNPAEFAGGRMNLVPRGFAAGGEQRSAFDNVDRFPFVEFHLHGVAQVAEVRTDAGIDLIAAYDAGVLTGLLDEFRGDPTKRTFRRANRAPSRR